MQFQKATKEQAKLRLALMGVSGSGKTYSALSIASGLGNKVALIDTERGSASKYADIFDFDVLNLDNYGPENFIQAINAAAQAGYEVLIIDSLSHAWMGILEIVDKRAAADPRSNSFAQWRYATPKHNQLVDTILKAPVHIIATIRTKTEWVVERDERTGKQVPKKIGTAPVQRDGIEYEFDMVGDLNIDHHLVVSKSRIPGFQDDIVDRPNDDFGKRLLAWLESGAVPVPTPTPAPTPESEPASAPPVKDEPKPEPKAAAPALTPLEKAMEYIPFTQGDYAGRAMKTFSEFQLKKLVETDQPLRESTRNSAKLVLNHLYGSNGAVEQDEPLAVEEPPDAYMGYPSAGTQ